MASTSASHGFSVSAKFACSKILSVPVEMRISTKCAQSWEGTDSLRRLLQGSARFIQRPLLSHRGLLRLHGDPVDTHPDRRAHQADVFTQTPCKAHYLNARATLFFSFMYYIDVYNYSCWCQETVGPTFFFPDSHIFYSCFSLYTFTIRAVLCKFVYFNVSENVVSGNYKFLVRGLFLFPFANTYT